MSTRFLFTYTDTHTHTSQLPSITCTKAYEKTIKQIIFRKHVNAAVYWNVSKTMFNNRWLPAPGSLNWGLEEPSRRTQTSQHASRSNIPVLCVYVYQDTSVISAKFRKGDAASRSGLRRSSSVLHRVGREAFMLTGDDRGMDTVSLCSLLNRWLCTK